MTTKLLARLLGVVVLTVTSNVGASTATKCVDQYEHGVRLIDAGALLAARQELRQCASNVCPSTLQRECVDVLETVEARIPTVIPVANDASKRDLPDTRVFLDGKLWKTRLDGREGQLDPGPHTFRFEAPGFVPQEQTFVVVEREKGRPLHVELAPIPADARKERASSSPPRPALFWGLGGIGVAALVTSGAFGIAGLSARSDANACRPSCDEAQVDTVQHRFLAADVALGVGVVALAATLFIELTRRR